ncbi:hypothetical protein LCGC14_2592940 [marine sediment metagenome]|uniref:Uncharacterized protein n=1 Tax=marine sediment metagenome TaxID=412755 RepID=A0A0F9AB42_9ZZZZ
MQSVQRRFKVKAITDIGIPAREVMLEQIEPVPDWPDDDPRWDVHFDELNQLCLEQLVVDTTLPVQVGDELILMLSKAR